MLADKSKVKARQTRLRRYERVVTWSCICGYSQVQVERVVSNTVKCGSLHGRTQYFRPVAYRAAGESLVMSVQIYPQSRHETDLDSVTRGF